MDKSLYLAIDQGGQSTRIAVYTATGEQRCCFAAPCATRRFYLPGEVYEHIEQSGNEILVGIESALEKIRVNLGNDIRYLKSAGLAGQGSSFLCWESDTGKVLSPIISWQDIRGEPYLKQLSLNQAQTQSLTGLRLSPHYGATKMRWCLDHNTQVKQAHQQNRLSIGPIATYLLQRLMTRPESKVTRCVIDPGHAQRTLLWNLTTRAWDPVLLKSFNVPLSSLPEYRHHNSIFGELALGDQRVPVNTCTRDQGASLFAHGSPDHNACYINIGTGAFVQRVSNNLPVPEGLLISPLWLSGNAGSTRTPQANSFLDPGQVLDDSIDSLLSWRYIDDLYAWEAPVNGAASAIPFIQQETGLAITPQEMDAALALSPQQDCYFLNAIGGLSAPWWRTDMQSRFSPHLSNQERILAWLESIVFQIVVNMNLMTQLGPIHRINISGGFSQANPLCQKIADLSQTPVYRSENPDATLQGIAYLAAGMPQNWCSMPAEKIFTPQSNAGLQSRFNVWNEAVEAWLAERNE